MCERRRVSAPQIRFDQRGERGIGAVNVLHPVWLQKTQPVSAIQCGCELAKNFAEFVTIQQIRGAGSLQGRLAFAQIRDAIG